MGDYKKSIIELVRGYPIIWDPTNKDYKNREQRKQVWEELNPRVKPPTGSNTHAKETWEHMTRSYSNALKRKDKRSGSGAGNNKEWKFEKDMMFLLPVKQLRNTSGNMPDTSLSGDVHSHFDDSQVSLQSQENIQDNNIQPDILPDTDTNTGGRTFENACKQIERKQPCMYNETNNIIKRIKQRQLESQMTPQDLTFLDQ